MGVRVLCSTSDREGEAEKEEKEEKEEEEEDLEFWSRDLLAKLNTSISMGWTCQIRPPGIEPGTI